LIVYVRPAVHEADETDWSLGSLWVSYLYYDSANNYC